MKTSMGGRRCCVILGALALATSVLVPAITSTAQPTSVPLPTALASPPPGNGEPWGAAAVEGATGSVDLAAFGYVEEEFIVLGEANVYRYDATGMVEVDTAGVPYATRILVRRPQDPRRFSGNVQVETSHPQFGINVVWEQTSEYVLEGDAFVSITTRRTSGFSAIELMKSFDPIRYGPLQFPEDGLNWDVIGQIGRLLKTPIPANPLHGYDVRNLYASGWSGGGALLLLYISDGFHARARMPDGSPIFDGYLVGEPSGYPRINSTVPAIPPSDPRQQVQPRDVPAITLHTRPQESFRRRPDGDESDDRYRVYEVAGGAHSDLRLARGVFPTAIQFEDTFLGGAIPPQLCVHEITRFPMHHLFKSTLARIDAWAARDVAPPPSQRIALQPDGSPVLDAHGNPVGGVRTTYTDVPHARYLANRAEPGGSCDVGGQERFSSDKLGELYRNHGGYVSRVFRRTNDLERDGWLLPVDAAQIQREAAHFDGI